MTQIPFWIQISAIAAAPLTGAVGVWYATRHTDLGRREEWFRTQRLSAYTAFGSAAYTLASALTVEEVQRARASSPEERAAQSAVILKLIQNMIPAISGLRLVAPPTVEHAASALLNAAQGLAMAAKPLPEANVAAAISQNRLLEELHSEFNQRTAVFQVAAAADVKAAIDKSGWRAARRLVKDIRRADYDDAVARLLAE